MNERDVNELIEAIAPLLNSIAMEFGHDSMCASTYAPPGLCNCTRAEAKEALQALAELRRRAETRA